MNRSFITRFVLVLLLILFVFVSYSEQVPRADGMGWDGVIYGGMMKDFLSQFREGGYSAYYIQKCLPFALIIILVSAFHLNNAFAVLIVLEMICFALAVVAFFKISDSMKLNYDSEIIAFALLFYTHSFHRFGYMPYGGDPFAFGIGLWIYYFFYTKQQWKMLCASAVGAFVWQSMWPVCLVLFVLPQEGYNLIGESSASSREKRFFEVIKLVVSVGLVSIPIKMFMLSNKRYGDWRVYADVVPYYFYRLPVWAVFVSTICVCVLFYLALKPISINAKGLCAFLRKTLDWKRIIVAVVLFMAMHYLISWLSNPEISAPGSFIVSIRRLLFEPFTVPLKFFAAHLANNGLMICLLVLLYSSVWKFVSCHSFGYSLALAMALAFGTQTESRFILNFFPFIVFPIVAVLNDVELKRWVPYMVCIVQLLLSGVWYKTNTPSLAKALETDDVVAYTMGDAQRVFYSIGPWMGGKAYLLFLLFFVIILIVLYLGKHNNWFVISKCETANAK